MGKSSSKVVNTFSNDRIIFLLRLEMSVLNFCSCLRPFEAIGYFSVWQNTQGNSPQLYGFVLGGLLFVLHKCDDLILVLSFRIKGLLADILGLKCGLDLAFCFVFYRVWYEWEYLWAGKYIHNTPGNRMFLFKCSLAVFSVRAKMGTWYGQKVRQKTTIWLPQISEWQNQETVKNGCLKCFGFNHSFCC